MGTRWKHWGDKGGEERNWPLNLTMPMAQDSVLSYRHFPLVQIVYGTYLYFYHPMKFIFITEIVIEPLLEVTLVMVGFVYK